MKIKATKYHGTEKADDRETVEQNVIKTIQTPKKHMMGPSSKIVKKQQITEAASGTSVADNNCHYQELRTEYA